MELAATPEEAMRRMIQDRGMSKKINYDSIKNLFPSQPPAKRVSDPDTFCQVSNYFYVNTLVGCSPTSKAEGSVLLGVSDMNFLTTCTLQSCSCKQIVRSMKKDLCLVPLLNFMSVYSMLL